MKLHFKRSLLILALTAFCSGGCAKHKLAAQDQINAPAAPSASALPAKSADQADANRETKDPGLTVAPITEQAQQTAATQKATDRPHESALERVFFDFDSHTLSPAAREALAKNAEILQREPGIKLLIEGHCDELGSDDYNLALGEKRARSAMNYLQSMGVASSRLTTISYGKEKPADPGHDDAARARNRRDEFVPTLK